MLNGFKIVAVPVAATAYKNVDGKKIFSKWSKTVSVKTKG